MCLYLKPFWVVHGTSGVSLAEKVDSKCLSAEPQKASIPNWPTNGKSQAGIVWGNGSHKGGSRWGQPGLSLKNLQPSMQCVPLLGKLSCEDGSSALTREAWLLLVHSALMTISGEPSKRSLRIPEQSYQFGSGWGSSSKEPPTAGSPSPCRCNYSF